MSASSQSKKDIFAGLSVPIDNKPIVERSFDNSTKETINTQIDKIINTEEHKNTRKKPNNKGNIQETIYITPDKKKKIALLCALLDKSKGEVLEEGIDYVLNKYSHLLKTYK